MLLKVSLRHNQDIVWFKSKYDVKEECTIAEIYNVIADIAEFYAYEMDTDTDNIKITVKQFIIAPTVGGDRIARVSEINIPEEKVEDIKPYLKIIEHKIDRESYLKFTKSMLKVVYMANLKGNDVANILIPKLVEKKLQKK